jgi:putative SOS response-associated peptidase YedK
LIVTRDNGRRRLSLSQWGLPALAFVRPVPARQRGVVFARDLVAGGRILAPQRLQRCLIVVEAFAYPSGQAGKYMRSWFGLRDRPLAAWAGMVMNDDGGCAGLLAPACKLIKPLSDHMPRLIATADHFAWLNCAGPLSLTPAEPHTNYYRENFGERWSTGAMIDASLLPIAASA